MAIELLLRASPDELAAAAEKLAADESGPKRSAATRFRCLVAVPLAERRQLAIAALAEKGRRRQVALGYLTQGISSLRNLEDLGLFLYRGAVRGRGRASAPRRKKRRDPARSPARPRRQSRRAAFVGRRPGRPSVGPATCSRCWANRAGSFPLLEHRRSAGAKRAQPVEPSSPIGQSPCSTTRKICPVLKQIYEQIKKDDDVKEFYWTIRVMTGPAALKFRSQVRKELGMERLQ